MTDAEYKFLEVIYQRGTIPETSLVNYLEGKIEASNPNQGQAITKLFSNFTQSGFISGSQEGFYRITELGIEKYKEVSRTRSVQAKPTDHVSLKKTKSFRPDSRFWLATIILALFASFVISMIINRWDRLMNIFHEMW